MNQLRTKNSNINLGLKSGCEMLSIDSIFLMTFTKLFSKAYDVHSLFWPTGKKNMRLFISLFEYYTSKCASEIQIDVRGRTIAQFKFTFN